MMPSIVSNGSSMTLIICPNCQSAVLAASRTCKHCGYLYPALSGSKYPNSMAIVKESNINTGMEKSNHPPISVKEKSPHDSEQKIGLPLGLAILAMPYLFTWVTLKSGYSNSARVISFAWMGLLIIFMSISNPHSNVDKAQSSSAIKSTPHYTPSNEETEAVVKALINVNGYLCHEIIGIEEFDSNYTFDIKCKEYRDYIANVRYRVNMTSGSVRKL